MKQKIVKKHFRVAIFGSARLHRRNSNYKHVYNLAKSLADEGIDIVTGGGPGLMDAASRGHYSSKNNKKVHSIGLHIKLPKEQTDSAHLDIKQEFNTFSKRLDRFISLSDVVVVEPGGIGTLLELFFTWQLVQVHHVCETPIILLGTQWGGLISWIKKECLAKKLMSPEDFDFVFIAKNNDEAMRIIRQVHKDSKLKAHICKNFQKYRK